MSEPAPAFVTLRGTRELRHRMSAPAVQVPPPGPSMQTPSYDVSAEALTAWRLSYVDPDMEAIFGAPPLIALVELLSVFSGDASVFVDANLLPDVAYRIEALYFGRSTVFTGPRRARRPEVVDGTLPLADIDAPLVRPGGRGGDYTRRGTADFAVSGGLATVEKLIWHRLFTPVGALDWSPGYGTSLRLKQMPPASLRAEEARLRRLVEEVPGVASATVTILFRDDHAVVSVRARTDFGELERERSLGGEA